MPPVTVTSCAFSLFSPPVKNPLKYPLHPLPSVALAGLMISEFSASCECRLFGTGLVVSENASDCTKNAAYRDRKFKKILGKGHSLLPQTRPPNPTLSILGAYGPSILAPSAFDLLSLYFHHLPPILTLLATGLLQPPTAPATRCRRRRFWHATHDCVAP